MLTENQDTQIGKSQILLTNDDGIRSPGLWAAAEALSQIGYVHVVAPRDQYSGGGRSLPSTSDGMITRQTMLVHGQTWEVYSVGGSPAQSVQHAVLEIVSDKLNLVVSGINFGENVGSGITISGTVGAALEAAALGIPAMAISLQTAMQHHYAVSDEVDFTVAAYFTQYFGRILLKNQLPPDVNVLKVDIPANATRETPWRMTRVSRLGYYEPAPAPEKDWQKRRFLGYRMSDEPEDDTRTDVYGMRTGEFIAVCPVSLDLTSRIDLDEFEQQLKEDRFHPE